MEVVPANDRDGAVAEQRPVVGDGHGVHGGLDAHATVNALRDLDVDLRDLEGGDGIEHARREVHADDGSGIGLFGNGKGRPTGATDAGTTTTTTAATACAASSAGRGLTRTGLPAIVEPASRIEARPPVGATDEEPDLVRARHCAHGGEFTGGVDHHHRERGGVDEQRGVAVVADQSCSALAVGVRGRARGVGDDRDLHEQ